MDGTGYTAFAREEGEEEEGLGKGEEGTGRGRGALEFATRSGASA